jgi:pimeloyl-ACP methyl ester carboxylesterase
MTIANRFSMTTSIIETAKGKIEYSMLGQGRILLIVHGGHVSCHETIFQKGLDSNKFCFITPSRPGYGATPLTEYNKTPKETADLFMALLDELKVPKATVIGISAGGLTALEIAANYPARVEKLVLMSALTKKWFAETDRLYVQGKKAFAPKTERYTWLLYRLLFKLIPKVITRVMFRELSKHRPIEFTEDEFKELKEMTLNMRSGYGFHNDLDQTFDQSTLSRIDCPTLILHSENDNAVDSSHPQNANKNIKHSKLMTFNNRWGHLLWLGTDYEPIVSVLKKYIEE